MSRRSYHIYTSRHSFVSGEFRFRCHIITLRCFKHGKASLLKEIVKFDSAINSSFALQIQKPCIYAGSRHEKRASERCSLSSARRDRTRPMLYVVLLVLLRILNFWIIREHIFYRHSELFFKLFFCPSI